MAAELNNINNKPESNSTDTSADIGGQSQKCCPEDNEYLLEHLHKPSNKHHKKDCHVAPRLINQPKESIAIPLRWYNAVCAGCGLLTSYAYRCKFCDAAIHIFCYIDPEELGHGAHYICPKCYNTRKVIEEEKIRCHRKMLLLIRDHVQMSCHPSEFHQYTYRCS
jgi:hypothetical protein